MSMAVNNANSKDIKQMVSVGTIAKGQAYKESFLLLIKHYLIRVVKELLF